MVKARTSVAKSAPTAGFAKAETAENMAASDKDLPDNGNPVYELITQANVDPLLLRPIFDNASKRYLNTLAELKSEEAERLRDIGEAVGDHADEIIEYERKIAEAKKGIEKQQQAKIDTQQEFGDKRAQIEANMTTLRNMWAVLDVPQV